MPATASARLPTIVGFVITVHANVRAHETVTAVLHSRPEIRAAPPNGAWIAATAETDDPRALHRWLESRPGVAAVDVVFVEVPPDAGAHPQGRTDDCSAAPAPTTLPAS